MMRGHCLIAASVYYGAVRHSSGKMGKGANGGYLRLRNANTAFSRPCRRQLRFACRDLKEIIDDRERQPPNLAQEPT
jgi:hypothetical protein